jgi:dihydroorotate dehydrogenase electron transfer subunit
MGLLHWISLDSPLLAQQWRAGQYLQILSTAAMVPPQLLLRAFFPAQVDTRLGRIGLVIDPQHDEATRWLSQCAVGTALTVYGPSGKLPQALPSRGTALCIGQHDGALRLLGIVNQLHQQHTSVTFVAGDLPSAAYIPPSILPTDVEFLAGSENVLRIIDQRLGDVLRWADHIYIAANAPLVSALRQVLRQTRLRAGKAITSVHITTPLPCGTQSCRQCLIQTRKGPRLACQVGPWIDITDMG